MNGFNQEIRGQILSGTPHITMGQLGGPLVNWKSLSQTLAHESEIVGVAPYIVGQAMLNGQSGQAQGVLVRGFDPLSIQSVYPALSKLQEGNIKHFGRTAYSILIGRTLAKNLGLSIGDKISVVIPEASVTPAGVLPRMKRFEIVGIFNIGDLYDDKQVFIRLLDADKLFRMHGTVSGIQLKIRDELKAPVVARNLDKKFNQNRLNVENNSVQQYWILDWTFDFGNFFKALKIQKTVMAFILFLIIAVAAFNLVSSLVMVVTDKRKDMAILRTMGASRRLIMRIFMLQGLVIGFIGSVCGVLLGIFLAMHLTKWVERLQAMFDIDLVSKELYLIGGFLPCEIHGIDVIVIAVSAWLMCFIATLYPAFKASRISPAEVLRYE
jgi:lipoprotein-releasing system permease protein